MCTNYLFKRKVYEKTVERTNCIYQIPIDVVIINIGYIHLRKAALYQNPCPAMIKLMLCIYALADATSMHFLTLPCSN